MECTGRLVQEIEESLSTNLGCRINVNRNSPLGWFFKAHIPNSWFGLYPPTALTTLLYLGESPCFLTAGSLQSVGG
jgi:hypothetical protein